MRETDIKQASRLSTGWTAYLIQQYLTFPNYFQLDCHHSKVSHSSRVSISFRSLSHFQTIFMLYTDIYLCILNIVLLQLLVYLLLYFLLLLLFSISLRTPDEDSLSKALVFNCSSVCRKRLCFIVPCVSSYRWVHFPRSVLFHQWLAGLKRSKHHQVSQLAEWLPAAIQHWLARALAVIAGCQFCCPAQKWYLGYQIKGEF